jgi:large subunit ribosomal protein L40e
MPVTDPYLRKISEYHLLEKKVCRSCGALNPKSATKCRRCKLTNLRNKRVEVKK